MRETNINKDIARTDIKVGDKIRITREVTVTAVRNDTIYGGSGKPRKPITIVTALEDTIGVTDSESVKLVERDKEPIFTVPMNALIIAWQDEDGYDHLARRNRPTDKWVTSQNGPKETFATEELIELIEDGEFDGYKEGSFEVLKHSTDFAMGGYVHGRPIGLSQQSVDTLNRLSRQRLVSPLIDRSPITGYPATH